MSKNVKKDIEEAKRILVYVMKSHLIIIADDIIKKIIAKWKKSKPSNVNEVPNYVETKSTLQYRKDLLSSLAIISAQAISQARTEVGGGNKIKLEENIPSLQLGEFEKLPKAIQRRISAQAQVLINTQLGDLEKSIYLQYGSSVGAPTLESELLADLEDKAYDYIEGQSVVTGAGVVGASTINEARNAFFFDDQVLEKIEAFQFINGDPVSLICRSLAGIIFPKNDPNAFKYTPPLHFNCKSYIVPILQLKKGQKMEKLSPRKVAGATNKQVMDSLQFAEEVKSCSCISDKCNNF